MLPGDEILSKLLGSLYEAAADPTLWDLFLQQLAESTGAHSAGLVMRDADQDLYTISHSWQIDPGFTRLYGEYYYSLDVWGERGLSKPSGYVCSSQELCRQTELTTTEVYNDFMAPAGVEHGMFIVVENRGSRFASVSLYRNSSRPPFETSDLEILHVLAPHAQRAFRLHFQFSRLKARSEGVETALDMLQTGAIFLGTKGEVVLMNRSASALVAERDGLLATRNGLRADRPGESTMLVKAIVRAVSTSKGNGFAPGGTVLVSRRARPPLQIQISPIRNSLVQTSQPIAAVAFVIDPLRRERPAQEVLRALYGLTPAECRVALLLGDGRAPRKIASMVGVSDSTVRSQIKSIFSKTGVKRQGELIRLLLSNSAIQWNPAVVRPQ